MPRPRVRQRRCAGSSAGVCAGYRGTYTRMLHGNPWSNCATGRMCPASRSLRCPFGPSRRSRHRRRLPAGGPRRGCRGGALFVAARGGRVTVGELFPAVLTGHVALCVEWSSARPSRAPRWPSAGFRRTAAPARPSTPARNTPRSSTRDRPALFTRLGSGSTSAEAGCCASGGEVLAAGRIGRCCVLTSSPCGHDRCGGGHHRGRVGESSRFKPSGRRCRPRRPRRTQASTALPLGRHVGAALQSVH